MRLFVLSTPLLLASTAFAGYHLKRSQNTDTCANLNADLVFSDFLIDGQPYVAGHIHLGLCVAQVKNLVGHYNVTEAAAKVVGTDKVEATVTAMIKQAGVQCLYPPHGKGTPTSHDECDFVCMDGFLAMPPRNPTKCICPPHLTECNGKCGHFRLDCSSTAPPSRRQNDPKCGKDLTMCGVPGASWGQAWKCTNVTSDSYTCGGCVKASPFGSSTTVGVNCHDIPHVDEVSCTGSECFVHTCLSGYKVTANNDGCVVDAKVQGHVARSSSGSSAGELLGSAASGVSDRFSPRSDAASSVISPLLSATKGAQSTKLPADIPAGTKVARGFAPVKGHGTADVTAKLGLHVRDVTDSIKNGASGKSESTVVHDADEDC